MLIGKNEILPAAVYKPPDQAWNDADIIELLSYRNKSLLAGYLVHRNVRLSDVTVSGADVVVPSVTKFPSTF
jgi:hypothetical protein